MTTTRTLDAAGFAIFDEKGQVLLVHQTYGKRKWGIPETPKNRFEFFSCKKCNHFQ